MDLLDDYKQEPGESREVIKSTNEQSGKHSRIH